MKTETCTHLTVIDSMEKALKRYDEERQEDPLYPYLVHNARAALNQAEANHRRVCKETP